MRNQQTGFSRLERFELKYTIPSYLVEPICSFCSPYCVLDKHSEITDDGFYSINNLYFDSPNFYLLKQSIGEADNRFNLRVRTYGKTGESNYHLEIKEKRKDIVKKYRSTINSSNWWKIFYYAGMIPDSEIGEYSYDNMRLFERLAISLSVEPKILTNYRRKALVSIVDDYARVTFDKELYFKEPDGYDMTPYDGAMHSYDTEDIFDPFTEIILELKCSSPQVPSWMLDLIKVFELKRRGFSKYRSGVLTMLGAFEYYNQDYVNTLS